MDEVLELVRLLNQSDAANNLTRDAIEATKLLLANIDTIVLQVSQSESIHLLLQLVREIKKKRRIYCVSSKLVSFTEYQNSEKRTRKN